MHDKAKQAWPPAEQRISLRDVLHFYKAAGVEDAVSDTAFDAFAAAPEPAKAAPPITKDAPVTKAAAQAGDAQAGQSERTKPAAAPRRAPPPQSHVPFETWLARAREQAQTAQNLAELKQRIAAFDGCNLKFTAKNTCIADGSAPQPLMLIGEGPGAEEDRQALPFVGSAGQLLNRMLAAIHFTRESLSGADTQQAERGAEKSEAKEARLPCAYITNAVFWRPPGNRNPTAEEIALCRPFLLRQIEFVRPKIIMALGSIAANAVLGPASGHQYSILRLRGTWQNYKMADGAIIPLMPGLHPAYLLRAASQKKLAWADFLAVKMRLRGE